MSRRKKRKDGKPSFTPPPTPHDIFKAVDRHGDLLARDLSDLRERGMMGPHMRVEAIPTRVYQAIQREARCGLGNGEPYCCLLYTSPSPRDATLSRMPSSA